LVSRSYKLINVPKPICKKKQQRETVHDQRICVKDQGWRSVKVAQQIRMKRKNHKKVMIELYKRISKGKRSKMISRRIYEITVGKGTEGEGESDP